MIDLEPEDTAFSSRLPCLPPVQCGFLLPHSLRLHKKKCISLARLPPSLSPDFDLPRRLLLRPFFLSLRLLFFFSFFPFPFSPCSLPSRYPSQSSFFFLPLLTFTFLVLGLPSFCACNSVDPRYRTSFPLLCSSFHLTFNLLEVLSLFPLPPSTIVVLYNGHSLAFQPSSR